jgi:polysaccharide biosynthesis protein PslH
MVVGAGKPDILFLAHRVPYPLDKGDRIRTFHLLRFLARRASVHVACLADEPVSPEALQVLNSICRRCHIIPLGNKTRWIRAFGSLACGRTITQGAFSSAPLRQLLRAWSQSTRFQVAMTSASSMAPYLQGDEFAGVPAVIDLMDVDSEKWLDYARSRPWPFSWVFRTEGRRLRRLEQDLCRWARAALVVSKPEADVFRSFSPWTEVHAVTNGVDLSYFAPETTASADQNSCVFVGALDYYPNIDAAQWFCREVWPLIHARQPQSKFLMVGRRPDPAVQRLTELAGVQLVRDVPDVRPYVSKATVVVVPLRIARGLQNKVLEALAMGKAVVASPPALAALKTRPGVHLLAASAAQEWTNAVLEVMDNECLRRALGIAGRKYVEDYHDWDHCLEPLTDLLGLASSDNETSVEKNREVCPGCKSSPTLPATAAAPK